MHTELIHSFVASQPVARLILQGWESNSDFYSWLLINSSLYYTRVTIENRRSNTNSSWQGYLYLWEVSADFTDHQLTLFRLVEDSWPYERARVSRDQWL